jgi:hypothetical protein
LAGHGWLMADGCCALEVAVTGRSLAMVVLSLAMVVLSLAMVVLGVPGLGKQVAVSVCVCVHERLGVAVTEGQLARPCMAVVDSPCLARAKQSKREKQRLISAPALHRYMARPN